jgi:signal transduction histidine kinase
MLNGLRFKWLVFTGLLLAYITFLILAVVQLRQTPLDQIAEYQRLQLDEDSIVKADLAVFHVVTMLFVDPEAENLGDIVQYFSLLSQQYQDLQVKFPEKGKDFAQLVELIPAVLEYPTAENLTLIQNQLSKTKYALDQLMAENREHRESLVIKIRESSDTLVSTSLKLGLLGIIVLGTISGVFLFRLTHDIRRLQSRVSEIMTGYRGEHLPSRRKDELGHLIVGVNQMASTLGEKEQELEIERRHSFYQEKMLAIENLAGGIAHEINNPISCIDGLAHLLEDEARQQSFSDQANQYIEGIVSYSEGLTNIMRDLQAMSQPTNDEYQLIDFNQLVTHVNSLIQYDAQQANTRIVLNLDQFLPAINGVEDQLALALSNILENSIDELKDKNDTDRVVTISTRIGKQMICCIEDSGDGIDPEVMPHLFDPFFSTKPVGHGTGLGLPLCKSVINNHGGVINIRSEQNVGTSVEIHIPFADAKEAING